MSEQDPVSEGLSTADLYDGGWVGEDMVAPLVVSEDGAELMVCGRMVLAYFCLGVNNVVLIG